MANSVKLVYSVGTTSGKKTWTINHVDSTTATRTRVIALANGFIANATMFNPQPIVFNAAKLVTTTETIIELSD